MRDTKSVVPSSPTGSTTEHSFQNFGSALMSPDLGESLLGNSSSRSHETAISTDESINGESSNALVEQLVVIVPTFILKFVKLPRFFPACIPNYSRALCGQTCLILRLYLQTHLRAKACHAGFLALCCKSHHSFVKLFFFLFCSTRLRLCITV